MLSLALIALRCALPFYGLTQNPFDRRELELLPGQQGILDTLKVHCQQGGLCLVLGRPGTDKRVIKQALQQLPEKQHLVAPVARTLHTCNNTGWMCFYTLRRRTADQQPLVAKVAYKLPKRKFHE